MARFGLVRDLLLLQLLIMEIGGGDVAEQIHSNLLPHTAVIASCYYVLVWATQAMAEEPASNAL